MSEIILFIEGFNDAAPLQAYCSVVTPQRIIIDTIYPYPNISIYVEENDSAKKFGDNAYTRLRVIKEMISLDQSILLVKYYYYRYKAVLRTYTEIESMEYDRYQNLSFANSEEDSLYQCQMTQRLQQIYLHYLQRVFSPFDITRKSEMVIKPYLLKQIIPLVYDKIKVKMNRSPVD